MVHPTVAPVGAGPDGSDGVKRILGAVKTVTAGVAELRNRGFGTGHGIGTTRTGLGARHAHLAINAARLWCQFMLDTLSDPRAPWRGQQKPPDRWGTARSDPDASQPGEFVTSLCTRRVALQPRAWR